MMAAPLSPLSPPRTEQRRSRCSINGSERASLREYMDDSDCIIQHTIQRYVKFARECYDGSVNHLHKRIGADHGVFLYEEKRETSAASSFVDEIWPGALRRESVLAGGSDTGTGRQPFSRITKLFAFGGGEIAGTLDGVMNGVHAETAEDHATNCSVQFGAENVVDSGIMESFDCADEANPFRFFGIKWVEVANEMQHDHSDREEFHRVPEVTIDELYWIERTGFYRTESGRKYGFHLLKTIESEFAMDDTLYRPVQMSVCYVYHQVENDTVHAFARGIIEIPHRADTDVASVISQASALMLAPTRGRQCQRMKMILRMIEKSKTIRSEMLACKCSKVVQGLPRNDLCSDCREVMQQCKLFSIHKAALRKTQLLEKARVSMASATTVSNRSSNSSASPSLSSPLPLRSRRGSVRLDGEVSEDIDPEVLSLRMLLPIRESRVASAYRETKKRHGNILTRMLLRYEVQRREIAADSIRPDSD